MTLAAMSNAKISGFLKKMNKALNLPKNSEVLFDVQKIQDNIDLNQEQESKIQELRRTNSKQQKMIKELQSFHMLDEFNCKALGDQYIFVMGKCYYIEEAGMSFLQGSDNCENRFGKYGSGQHFEPMDQLCNDIVIQAAREIVGNNNTRFWLGIIDVNSTNEWTFQSSGNLAAWTNWDSGQPDNNGGNLEDCSVAWNPSDFKWHDDSCSHSHKSICEYVPKLFDCEGMGSNYAFVLGNCYYMEETANEYANASINCEDKFGAHGYGKLFEPKNKYMNDKVIQVAREIVTTSNRFWLGIVDVNSTNEWAFHSNGNLVSWTNWDIDGGDGQPNNGHGCCNGEECVASWNPSDFEWHDNWCTYPLPSICEFTMVPRDDKMYIWPGDFTPIQ